VPLEFILVRKIWKGSSSLRFGLDNDLKIDFIISYKFYLHRGPKAEEKQPSSYLW